MGTEAQAPRASRLDGSCCTRWMEPCQQVREVQQVHRTEHDARQAGMHAGEDKEAGQLASRQRRLSPCFQTRLHCRLLQAAPTSHPPPWRHLTAPCGSEGKALRSGAPCTRVRTSVAGWQAPALCKGPVQLAKQLCPGSRLRCSPI